MVASIPWETDRHTHPKGGSFLPTCVGGVGFVPLVRGCGWVGETGMGETIQEKRKRERGTKKDISREEPKKKKEPFLFFTSYIVVGHRNARNRPRFRSSIKEGRERARPLSSRIRFETFFCFPRDEIRASNACLRFLSYVLGRDGNDGCGRRTVDRCKAHVGRRNERRRSFWCNQVSFGT